MICLKNHRIKERNLVDTKANRTKLTPRSKATNSTRLILTRIIIAIVSTPPLAPLTPHIIRIIPPHALRPPRIIIRIGLHLLPHPIRATTPPQRQGGRFGGVPGGSAPVRALGGERRVIPRRGGVGGVVPEDVGEAGARAGW